MIRAETTTEWKTVVLAAAIYGAWLGLMFGVSHLPIWVIIGLLAVVIAWHGSLQHEVVHDHPFASHQMNRLLATPPLGMRVPFPVYRRGHLEHHRAVALTNPLEDTESYYLQHEKWASHSRAAQMVLRFHHTLTGRLLLGPVIETPAVWLRELRSIRAGNTRLGLWWAEFLVECGALVLLATLVFDLPWWAYFVSGYLGHSLGLVRSFAEHRWMPLGETRSATVRAGRLFSLLFLNNNLHHAHHARPSLAWYHLPQVADDIASNTASAKGAGLYRGYRDIFSQFLFRPQVHALFPPDRSSLDVLHP